MSEDDPGIEDDNAVADSAAGVSFETAINPDPFQRAIQSCAAELARSQKAGEVVGNMLALIGEALGACQIKLYQNKVSPDSRLEPVECHVWQAAHTTARNGAHALFNLTNNQSDHLTSHLANGEAVQVSALTAGDHVRQTLEAGGVSAALFVPVFVDERWWGEAEIDRCDGAQAWPNNEIGTCSILSGLIGAAIVRTRVAKELADAARIIENSATFLFRFSAEKPYAVNYISNNIQRYGYRANEILASPMRYLELIHPDDLPKALEDILRVTSGGTRDASRDIRLRASDGRYLWFEVRMAAVRNEAGRVVEVEGLAIDIDKRKTAESDIARYTRTDQITGLGNRTAFMDELRHAFAGAKRGANPFAILYIDLDHFKDVNEVLGHSKGDSLLKLVAMRLQGAVRNGDFVARFGGDEFAILQLDISDPSDAGALAARVLRDLSEPPYDIGTQVGVTASIGIAFFDKAIAEPEEMIKQADMALYRAKDTGRNQFHFHSEALDVAIIERVTLAGDLRRGLERGEFELYYQPQVEVETGRIVGMEALTRWHHAKLGLLQPSHFIPIAEKTGTIIPLGRWVIDEVCQQILAWHAAGLSPPKVALNVSTVQIKATPDFDGDLIQTLRRWGIDPSAIELELTESVLMTTTREHRDIIERLHRLGISVAIDDFGTGYSSLGYLRAYRVNHIKIAQEFIRNIEEGSGDVAIVRAAISLARELGIAIIAEGVETAYQLKLLTDAGCRYVQGFYFSPPVTASEAAELLKRGTIAPRNVA